jgi:hypothetical protein
MPDTKTLPPCCRGSPRRHPPVPALSARIVAPKVMPVSVSPVIRTPNRTREIARISSVSVGRPGDQ